MPRPDQSVVVIVQGCRIGYCRCSITASVGSTGRIQWVIKVSLRPAYCRNHFGWLRCALRNIQLARNILACQDVLGIPLPGCRVDNVVIGLPAVEECVTRQEEWIGVPRRIWMRGRPGIGMGLPIALRQCTACIARRRDCNRR